MRTCSRCGVEKQLSEFAPRSRRGEHVYYAWCKTCYREYSRERSCTPIGKYTKLKSAAKLRDGEVISFAAYVKLVSTSRCGYCDGTLPERGYGLDRKDTARGYTEDNVITCCDDCNRTKGDMWTYEEFLKIAEVLKDIKRRRAA